MQWLFSAALYVQFEVSKSILVISVYSRLFFREAGLRVTLKTNKTTSAVLIFFFSEGSGETGPTFYLGRQQFQRLQIGQPADAIIYQWSRMSALLYTSLLFAPYCLLPAFVKGALYGGERREKIFLSYHQWINGDVFTRLEAQCSLRNNGY